MSHRLFVTILVATALATACDRNMGPYVPGEEPSAPDLTRIFPPGAERAAPDGSTLPPAPSRGAPPVAAPSGLPIRGVVSVEESLVARISGGATLFLIARGPNPGPPVAVKRIASPDFPLAFAIGPDDRMIAAIPFAGPLEISARLDMDGNATTRSPGDLVGAAPGSVAPGTSGVRVVIDEVL